MNKVIKDFALIKRSQKSFDATRQPALEAFRELCASGAHPDLIEMEILSTVSAMRQIADLTVRT